MDVTTQEEQFSYKRIIFFSIKISMVLVARRKMLLLKLVGFLFLQVLPVSS